METVCQIEVSQYTILHAHLKNKSMLIVGLNEITFLGVASKMFRELVNFKVSISYC